MEERDLERLLDRKLSDLRRELGEDMERKMKDVLDRELEKMMERVMNKQLELIERRQENDRKRDETLEIYVKELQGEVQKLIRYQEVEEEEENRYAGYSRK